MGTSRAANAPTTKKWNKVPSALHSPSRNASTIVDAVVSATIPMVPTSSISTPAFYAAYEGVHFISEVRKHGFDKAVERTAIRVSEKYIAPSIAKGVWDVAASKIDPKFVSSPYGRLAEVAFRRTISSIVSKGIKAMEEE